MDDGQMSHRFSINSSISNLKEIKEKKNEEDYNSWNQFKSFFTRNIMTFTGFYLGCPTSLLTLGVISAGGS